MRRIHGGPDRAGLEGSGYLPSGRSRRRARPTFCEPLEPRRLLASLEIVSGDLSFVAGPGMADNLSISVTGSSGSYIISDSAEPITLGRGAIRAGWRNNGPNTATGPVASVSSIAADTKDGNDTVTIASTEAPVALTFTNLAGNLDTVVIGAVASTGMQGVAGSVSIDNVNGVTALTLDDSADTQGQAATITSTSITGLAPGAIDYASARLDSLSVNGGEGGNTFTIASLPSAIVTLGTGVSAAIDPNHANINTIVVQNTTDPSNQNTLVINSQGLDTVDLSGGTAIKVTGTTKVPHAADPLTVSASGPSNGVTLVNSASGSLNGAVLLQAAPGSTRLTIDDSADATARVVLVSGGVIAGILPSQVSYNPDDLSSLTLIGAGRLDTLNVNAGKRGPVAVVAGAGLGSGTITIGGSSPLGYQNMGGVNITNAADQGLIAQNTSVVTTTGDTPLEGKAFPFLVASFVDQDVNAKSSNFTAVINWGDGSASSAGSISAQGTVNGLPLFDVSASHTYTQAGTYSVVVTITDTGTGASPSEVGGIPVTITDLGGSALTTGSTTQVNLVSNGAYPAANTDANLVNPWGIASSPGGPFWVGANGTGLATVYNGAGVPQSLVVSIPGGSPTGVAYNPFAVGSPSEFVITSGSTSGPAIFLFATQTGQIDGWNPGVPPPASSTSAQVAATVAGANFTGLALATNGGSDVLYAADFHGGVVDMFDANFNLTGSFTDPTLPAGYAPYNVVNINGNLYVTFAKQDSTGQNPVPGLGQGFVEVFSPAGQVLSRLVSNAPLDEPWGVALAPANFGQFSGDLLVANHGDGRINAFNPATGAFLGPLVDGSNNPMAISGLHGLLFGNGGSGGAANTLYFTAGSTSGDQGLLGSLTATPSTALIGEAALKASVVNVSAVEGNSFVGVVSNFTDDNPYSQAGDFTATINWGDGSSSIGTVQAGNGVGAYVVAVSSAAGNAKTYADETGSAVHLGPYNISVTITENDEAASVTADGFASVADAPLLPAVGLAPVGTLDVNSPIPVFTTATFVDTNPGATPSDFVSEGQSSVALIDWGDGSASLGKVVALGAVAGGESFAVQGGHTYLKGGPFQIKTSVVDIGGKSTSATANVLVNALHASVVNVSAVEGNLFSGVIANFTDDNTMATAGDFSAVVNWGALGVGSSVSIIPGSTAGAFIVLGTFIYAEETGSAVQPQPYNIAVTINDAPIGGGSIASVGGFASVADAALVSGPTLGLSVTEGTTPTGVVLASFADANPLAIAADFIANGVAGAATIDWGDGTASLGTITGPVGGPFTITGTKPSPYLKVGTSEIKIAVTDLGGKSTSMVANATITEAGLNGSGVDVVGTEGEPLIDPITGSTSVEIATFTDPNTSAIATDFRASIDWGDGTAGSGNVIADPSGVAGLFDVLGSHKYAKAGTYDITVTINDSAGDAGGFQLQIDPTADIGGETLAPGQSFPPLPAKANTPLNNIGIGTFLVTTPTPIPGPQPDSAADFSVSINWGDGVTNDTVTGSVSIVGSTTVGGKGYTVFRVSGSHTYKAAKPAGFTVAATITDDDGTDFPVGPLTVIVQPTTYALTAEPATANLPEGVPEDGEVIATITDANPNAAFAPPTITSENPDVTAANATIAPVAGSSNVYVVTADLSGNDATNSGAERDGGGLLISITDTNSNMSTAVSSQANLYDPVLIDPGVKVQAAPARSFQGPVASFSTTDPRATSGEFSAVINWGDGQSSSGTIVSGGSAGFLVVGDHTYATPGLFSVSTTITNDEGMTVSDTSTASVSTPIRARGEAIAPLARKAFAGSVATFQSAGPVPVGDFSASIAWSDGTSSQGVILGRGATRFIVLGSHRFTRRMRLSGTVIILENGSAQATLAIGGRVNRRVATGYHTAAPRNPTDHPRKPDLFGDHPQGPHAFFASLGRIDWRKSRGSGHTKS